MSTKKTIDVLRDLRFTSKEVIAFNECVQAVKTEQEDGDFEAEPMMREIVEGLVEDENS